MAIYINTNQNVQIQYEISSIADRILAYLIDALVMGGIVFGVFLLASKLHFGALTFFVMAIIFFYHLICELLMDGQSFGKRSRGIRVMKKDGTAATFSGYFLRFLLRPIDSFYFIGLAIIFFTSRNQRLGDLAAGTIVVNVKSDKDIQSEIKSQMSIGADREIMYPTVVSLTDQEIAVIRQVLDNRVDDRSHDNVLKLAKKISDKIGETLYQPNAYQFLRQVVQDYNRSHLEV